MARTLVTLEGTRTPSVQLATGARVTVLLTDDVQRRVSLGYVTIVNEITQYDDDESGGGVQEPSTNVFEPPAKNASREEWAAFIGTLTEPTIDVDLSDPDVGRNDLIALYQQWCESHDAPEPAPE